MPRLGIRLQHFPVSLANLLVRQHLLHPVQRPTLADVAAQFTVVAGDDLLQRTPQGDDGTQVMGHVQGTCTGHLADQHPMGRGARLLRAIAGFGVGLGFAADEQLGHLLAALSTHI
ncbi:hypothetical protein D3C75_1089740 [compost metagenome]